MNLLEKYLLDLVRASQEERTLIGKVADNTQTLIDKINNLKGGGGGGFAQNLAADLTGGAITAVAITKLRDKIDLNRRRDELQDRKEVIQKKMESTEARLKMAQGWGTGQYKARVEEYDKEKKVKEKERYSVERVMLAERSQRAMKQAFSDMRKAKEYFGVENLRKKYDEYKANFKESNQKTEPAAEEKTITKQTSQPQQQSGIKQLMDSFGLGGKLGKVGMGLAAAKIAGSIIGPGEGSAGGNLQQYQNQMSQVGDNAWGGSWGIHTILSLGTLAINKLGSNFGPSVFADIDKGIS